LGQKREEKNGLTNVRPEGKGLNRERRGESVEPERTGRRKSFRTDSAERGNPISYERFYAAQVLNEGRTGKKKGEGGKKQKP